MGTYQADLAREAKLRTVVDELFAAIVAKDVGTIMSHYLPEDRLLIFLEGPTSTVEGWDETFLHSAWSELLEIVTFSNLQVAQNTQVRCDGSTGWVCGEVTTTYGKISDLPTEHRSVLSRGTWLFEEVAGRWYIAAEHVSFAVPNPYPLDSKE
jgi:ketosteroid isomerase-like protein